jgi:radical SAM-linked protein
LSFGPPLAFGLITSAEYFDLLLERDVTSADIDALRDALPDGISMIRAEGMPAQIPSLTETLNEAVYAAMIPVEPEVAQAAIQNTLSQPQISWTRTDRPHRPPVDPRKSLKATAIEIKPEGVEWSINLMIGGSGSIRPDDWASLLFGFETDQSADLSIERTELLIRHGDRVRSPFDFP